MANVLKITDNKGTNHIVPLAVKSFWLSFNNRMKPENKVTITEISEAEAADVPFKDPSWVNPVTAQAKLGDLQKLAEDQNAKIEELMKQIAAFQTPAVPFRQEAEPSMDSIEEQTKPFTAPIPSAEEIVAAKKKAK
jgi:hypothetical protein